MITVWDWHSQGNAAALNALVTFHHPARNRIKAGCHRFRHSVGPIAESTKAPDQRVGLCKPAGAKRKE